MIEHTHNTHEQQSDEAEKSRARYAAYSLLIELARKRREAENEALVVDLTTTQLAPVSASSIAM